MAKRQSQSQGEEIPDKQEAEQAPAPPPMGQPTVGTRLTAREIYDNVCLAAEEELRRPRMALFWSALACGLTIGFSFLAAAYLTTWRQSMLEFIVSAVLGNIGGGFLLVALLNHGQVAADRNEREERS